MRADPIVPARPLLRVGEAELEASDQDGDGSIYCRGISKRLALCEVNFWWAPKG